MHPTKSKIHDYWYIWWVTGRLIYDYLAQRPGSKTSPSQSRGLIPLGLTLTREPRRLLQRGGPAQHGPYGGGWQMLRTGWTLVMKRADCLGQVLLLYFFLYLNHQNSKDSLSSSWIIWKSRHVGGFAKILPVSWQLTLDWWETPSLGCERRPNLSRQLPEASEVSGSRQFPFWGAPWVDTIRAHFLLLPFVRAVSFCTSCTPLSFSYPSQASFSTQRRPASTEITPTAYLALLLPSYLTLALSVWDQY